MIDPKQEACRIVILRRPGPGGLPTIDVAAPMKHKALCYEILRDARTVIERTGPELFLPGVVLPARIVIVMSMAGVVDVAAPLPNKALCLKMLEHAREVIERYDDASAPPARAFDGALLGE